MSIFTKSCDVAVELLCSELSIGYYIGCAFMLSIITENLLTSAICIGLVWLAWFVVIVLLSSVLFLIVKYWPNGQ